MTLLALPHLPIPASSRFFVRTWGPNEKGGFGLVNDKNIPFTDVNSTAFLTIEQLSTWPKTVLLARAPMSWVLGTGSEDPPNVNRWEYEVTAGVCRVDSGPWAVTVEVFDELGLSGVLLHTFVYLGIEDTEVAG